MTRGQSVLNKVHYKGKDDDFLVFVDDVQEFQKWKGDSSVPLVDFVSSFKVYLTHKQGAQGTYDSASKSALSNEFGTENEDECIKKILQQGNLQATETNPNHPGRGGDRNETLGPRQAH